MGFGWYLGGWVSEVTLLLRLGAKTATRHQNSTRRGGVIGVESNLCRTHVIRSKWTRQMLTGKSLNSVGAQGDSPTLCSTTLAAGQLASSPSQTQTALSRFVLLLKSSAWILATQGMRLALMWRVTQIATALSRPSCARHVHPSTFGPSHPSRPE